MPASGIIKNNCSTSSSMPASGIIKNNCSTFSECEDENIEEAVL